MDPITFLLVIIIILWLAGYFGYGRSRWGWGPHGDWGTVILIVLIVLILVGRI